MISISIALDVPVAQFFPMRQSQRRTQAPSILKRSDLEKRSYQDNRQGFA
jgi:hypothetical protein